MFFCKNVKLKKGFINTCAYNFNTSELLLMNNEDVEAVLNNEKISEALLKKLYEHKFITSDYDSSEENPFDFDYSLFDDCNTSQTCNTLYFEITDKCNYNCVHCYADMSPNGKKHLTPQALKKYLDNTDITSPFDIRLTGGEPFLNPYIVDMIDIISNSVKPHNRHSIVTNGSFDIKKALHALEAGFELQISIYGLNKQTFESFSRANALFYDRVFDNLRSLSKTQYKSQITLLLSINSLTYDEIEDFVEFCEQLGFKPMLNRPASIGRAITNWDYLKLSSKQHIDFNRYNKHLVKGYNRYCFHACRLTWSYVDIDGNVKPCAFIRTQYVFGNLFEKKLSDIRNNSKYNEFCSLNASSFDKCNMCEFEYACTGGCCGETLEYTGKISNTYPWCIVKPYKNSYMKVQSGEAFSVEKYSGGTFDFIKI